MIKLESPVVFILGAGFTKAFDKDAPLMSCDIQFSEIKKKYEQARFPNISRFLDAVEIKAGGEVNIEDLLTRLYIGSPYDFEAFNSGEREILLNEIKGSFEQLLENIKFPNPNLNLGQTLSSFAKYIIENEASVITFNYDTLLDQALFDYRKVYNLESSAFKYWHPDGGYGFFCRPSLNCIHDGGNIFKDSGKALLLKLHGSINWKVKRGTRLSYPLDAIVHDEKWHEKEKQLQSHPYLVDILNFADIEKQLEKGGFIIPPTLDKTIINNEPVLRLVWEAAYKKLLDAKTVIFIGYSLPSTDFATKFLLKEGLFRSTANKPNIIVVNRAGDEEKKQKHYEEILKSQNATFVFDGAVNWIENNIKPLVEEVPISKEIPSPQQEVLPVISY